MMEIPKCTNWVTGNDKDDCPEVEGWYHVMHAGDSESVDGFTIYEYGDYAGWAYWAPYQPEETHEIEGFGKITKRQYVGGWSSPHDDADSIFAWYGPIVVPEFPKGTMPS